MNKGGGNPQRFPSFSRLFFFSDALVELTAMGVSRVQQEQLPFALRCLLLLPFYDQAFFDKRTR